MANTIEGLNISSGELTATAVKVRNINNKLSDDLDRCSNAVKRLDTTWQSDAASEIRSAMEAMAPRFKEFYDVTESYCKFLDTTAAAYEEMEGVHQSNAALFS